MTETSLEIKCIKSKYKVNVFRIIKNAIINSFKWRV